MRNQRCSSVRNFLLVYLISFIRQDFLSIASGAAVLPRVRPCPLPLLPGLVVPLGCPLFTPSILLFLILTLGFNY